MKILFVTLDDYPHIGGKSTHMSSLIAGLKLQNVESHVFSRNQIDTLGLKIIKLFMQPIKLFSVKKYLYYRKFVEFALFKKSLKRHLNKNNYDVISAQDATSCTIAGRLYKNTPIVLTMHTYFGLEYTLDNNYFNLEDRYYKKLLAFEEESLKYVKQVVAVDTRIQKHIYDVIEKFHYNSSLYTVSSIANFTNTEQFDMTDRKNQSIMEKLNITDKSFIVMCIRRLVEKNGVIFAVNAMKYIPENYSVKLIIVGDGPEKEKIEKVIDENNLSSNVILTGAINNNELSDWYSVADCVVVPSITVNGLQEATSISAIESMACGKPTIASNIGGIKELIKHEETGLLVSEQDSKVMADAIIKLINDKKQFKNIGQAAREYIVKNHSHMVVAEKYLFVFNEAGKR